MKELSKKAFSQFKKFASFLIIFSSVAMAAPENSPVGRWFTIDDETGEKKSIVEISESNGELKGKVVEILTKPTSPDDHFCTLCEGDKKDKPIKGMEIMWGYHKESDVKWSGGQILDPDNGKVYSSHVTLEEEGKKLDVRGFIGFSLIGRSQQWVRE